MSTTPTSPATKADVETIDPEIEKIILERDATFEQDAAQATDAREALAEIRRALKQPR